MAIECFRVFSVMIEAGLKILVCNAGSSSS